MKNSSIMNRLVKKSVSDVDNCPGFSEKRYQMICQIQSFLQEGCSYREIAKQMGLGRNTIAKYRNGNPKELSMYGIRQSKLDPFYDFILQCLNSGWSKSKTVKAIYEKGYIGSKSNAFEHLVKLEEKENKSFEVQPYKRTMTEGLKYKIGSIGKNIDYITREGVFRHMWMNTELTEFHKEYISNKYPNISELHCCIREFRKIFKKKNVPFLYLFIEKYKKSKIKSIKSFASGLERDIDAVENAVAYDYSNGFVEGTNSRLKMIKRTMYGRCGKRLLEAKLRCLNITSNG
jgi:transcriptional regulator with XRE-family HTH domain